MKNIYLVGFMASGKTTVGKRLSKRLKKDFIDLDGVIEQREDMRIADIFKQKGEPYFRSLEKGLIKEISLKRDLIVACGGGAVANKENLRALKASGLLICLKAGIDTIIKRNKGTNKRPLLNVDNPQERIKDLLEKREQFYNQADYVIDTSKLNIDEVVEQILDLLKNRKQ